MAFATVVSRTSGTTGDQNNLVVPIPGSAVAGDLFVIGTAMRFTGSITWPANWDAFNGAAQHHSNVMIYDARKKILSAGDISTGSVTIGKGFTGPNAWVAYLFRDATGDVEGTGWSYNTYDPGYLAPSWGLADNLWIAVTGARGDQTVTGYPAGYSSGMNPHRGDAAMGSAEKQSAAASEDPAAFTWTDTGYNDASTWVVKPTPTPPPPVVANTMSFIGINRPPIRSTQ